MQHTNAVGQQRHRASRAGVNGNENALGFSLRFDLALFSFAGSTLGGTPNASALANTPFRAY